jgi:hypothetical protein
VGLFVAFFGGLGAFFLLAYNVGNHYGIKEGEDLMRPKVVEYCIEKPKLCKQEYDHNKALTKLKEYKRPEIEETK